MQTIPHPTKEQVRLYMMLRGRAHHPPPAPDEIRRQLGWSWRCDDATPCLIFPSPQFGLFFPGTLAQLSAAIAVEWMFLASGFYGRE